MIVDQIYMFYKHELLDNYELLSFLNEIDDYDYNEMTSNIICIYKLDMGIFFKRPQLVIEDKVYYEDYIKIPEYRLGWFSEDISTNF